MAEFPFTESTVEEAALELFSGLGYSVLHGPDIAPGELLAERNGYSEVVLVKRLQNALVRINPKIPASAVEDALRKLLRTESPSLVENNRRFHRFLTEGVPVEYRDKDRIIHDNVQLFDFSDLAKNDWLAVNQFTVVGSGNSEPLIPEILSRSAFGSKVSSRLR